MGKDRAMTVDVEGLVRENFQQYLGSIEGMTLEEQVIAEAGVDSILLVTILTDLFGQVDLDLRDAEIKLAGIQTLADVAALLSSTLEKSALAK
jgi:acyl carrier protein